MRGDGVHHHDVAGAWRGAGLQGQPHHQHLCAAPGVVLLLPVRGAARDQAAQPGRPGDHRGPHVGDDPAVPAALLRPPARAPARAPADRHDHGPIRDWCNVLPHLGGCQHRLAVLRGNRHAGGGASCRRPGARAVRRRQERDRLQRLPGVPQARRQRQQRAGPRIDAYRLADPAPGDRAYAGQSRRSRCPPSGTCRRSSSKRPSNSSRS